jgi:hypothetical protein
MRRLEVLECLTHTATGQMDVRRKLADEPVDTLLEQRWKVSPPQVPARRLDLAPRLSEICLQECDFPQPQGRKGQTVVRRVGLGQAGALCERLTGLLQPLLLRRASTPFAAFQGAGTQMGQQLQAQACRLGLWGGAHEA